jgi:hypothetical protein
MLSLWSNRISFFFPRNFTTGPTTSECDIVQTSASSVQSQVVEQQEEEQGAVGVLLLSVASVATDFYRQGPLKGVQHDCY